MSNYACGTMWLELPNENAEKFLNLFLSNNTFANEKKERYFHRSTLMSFNMQKVFSGCTELAIDFTSAGSLGDCLIDIPLTGTNKKCVTLEDVCKELDVKILAAVGEELVEGFKEKIRYIKGQPFFYQKSDTPYHLNSQDWEEWKSNMEMEAE